MPMRTPEAQREYQRRWVARRRAAWLSGKSCVTCGATNDLEVDHVDRAKKISHSVWSWAERRRNRELAKCQVLCKRCHQKKTVAEGPQVQHGTNSAYTNPGWRCRCAACKKAHREANALYR